MESLDTGDLHYSVNHGLPFFSVLTYLSFPSRRFDGSTGMEPPLEDHVYVDHDDVTNGLARKGLRSGHSIVEMWNNIRLLLS